MHECTVGILHDHYLDKTNIIEHLHNEAHGWNSHAKTMNFLKQNLEGYKPLKSDYKATDFLDKRKSGSMSMFNNCPYCGAKIDWKAIKQSVSVPTKTTEPNEHEK